MEYAFNRDPRIPDTNAPVLAALEVNPTDNLPHITLTYQRRLEPTDAAYAPAISGDLATWYPGPEYFEELPATDDGNGLTATVKDRVFAPFSSATNQFPTVRVWLRATGPP